MDVSCFNKEYPTAVVLLVPVTSKDIIGNCQMEIPLADVPKLIKVLQMAIK
jgi:hypothetical protein